MMQTCILLQTLSASQATPGTPSQQPQTLGCAATLCLHISALLTYSSALLHAQSAMLPANTTNHFISLAARVCPQQALLAPRFALPVIAALQLDICMWPLPAVAQAAFLRAAQVAICARDASCSPSFVVPPGTSRVDAVEVCADGFTVIGAVGYGKV